MVMLAASSLHFCHSGACCCTDSVQQLLLHRACMPRHSFMFSNEATQCNHTLCWCRTAEFSPQE